VPKTDFERQTAAMAGTMWIDEALPYVMRVESYFLDKYSRNVQGSSLRLEFTLFNDEGWLPSGAQFDAWLDFPIGKPSTFRAVVQYTDHKKFTVESRIRSPDERP
jgi:hypothetical protein